MRKIVLFMLFMVATCAVAGCVNSNLLGTPNKTSTPEITESVDSSPAAKSTAPDESNENHEPDDIDKSDNVLVDRDGIKITYRDMELIYLYQDVNGDEAFGLYVTLKIENTSEYEIWVVPVDSSVNNVMMTMALSGMPMTTLSGKSLLGTFFFTNLMLKGTGIESSKDIDKVEKVELKLTVYNNETIEELFTTDAITITP